MPALARKVHAVHQKLGEFDAGAGIEDSARKLALSGGVAGGPFWIAHERVAYSGEWRFCERSGVGVQVAEDGSIYEGYFKRDKKHLWGRQIYSNGELYEGEWKNGQRDGQGRFLSLNLETYSG